MNGMLKFVLPIASMATVMLVACGDDGSSDFDLEDSFEMVLDKAEYSYESEDSTFKLIKPVCKTSAAGTLIGPDDASEWDTVAYDAYLSKSKVRIRKASNRGEWSEYSFKDGSSFPVGLWLLPSEEKNSISYGYRLTKKDVAEQVFRYDGTCFASDLVTQFFEKNEALAEADESLMNLFKMFLPKKDDTPMDSLKKKLIHDIKKVDCNELMINGIFVKIMLENFNENSGKLRLEYSKDDDVSCDIDFRIRYAGNQTDCEEAFDEYKESESKKDFDFYDYWKSVSYDGKDQPYCVTKMVNSIMEDNDMLMKKSPSSVSEKDVLNALVDVILMGFER